MLARSPPSRKRPARPSSFPAAGRRRGKSRWRCGFARSSCASLGERRRRDSPTIALNLVEAREVDPPRPRADRLRLLHPSGDDARRAVAIVASIPSLVVAAVPHRQIAGLRPRGQLSERWRRAGMPGRDRARRRRERHAAVQAGEAGDASPPPASSPRRDHRHRDAVTSSKARPRNREPASEAEPRLASWCVARLAADRLRQGCLPGPITFVRGLRRFHAIAEGFHLAASNGITDT